MKGLELHRRFTLTWCLPFVRREFPTLADRVALAAVGGGSDIYGFDDEISMSHMWFPRCLFFLPAVDWQEHGGALQEAIRKSLPTKFEGVPTSSPSTWGPSDHPSAVGSAIVMSIPSFFEVMVGHATPPSRPIDWLEIPECDLYHATNGEVFHDPSGQLSAMRVAFGRYPRTVWWRRLQNQLLILAVDVLYNMGRCLPREDDITGMIWSGEGVKAIMRAVYLLNDRYAPYDKWLYAGFRRLQELASDIDPLLQRMVHVLGSQEKYLLFVQCVKLIVGFMMDRDLVQSRSLPDDIGAHGCQFLDPVLADMSERIPEEMREVPIAEESKVFC